jgi:hypothetical protein
MGVVSAGRASPFLVSSPASLEGGYVGMSRIEREVSEARDKARAPAAHKVELSRDYPQMLTIRGIEEAPDTDRVPRKFGGFLHLYAGQKAVAVGARHGKETGCPKGPGGWMNLFDAARSRDNPVLFIEGEIR